MIMDIAETFDNLRKINMKLNSKKCSFGFEERKFLGNEKLEWEAGDAELVDGGCKTHVPGDEEVDNGAPLLNYSDTKRDFVCLSRCILRRPHPIKVITDQPIKQILNKPEVSGKLAKYAVELGAYNITYVPQNTVKGQVLADFLNETPIGTKHIEICSLAGEEANLEE
ncbi:hypothetical protein Tco_0940073 [Tanacetum coccineum]|uniref:Uncharacterized protein n=1 Tax=Tanacetum coccineum TaxID=301880 RepID=A0ABQ5DMQ4_9ASTR